MINFKEFYEPIEFNLDKEVHKIFRFTQGDTKSRGLIITVYQGNVLKSMDGTETMKFFAQKSDGTRVIIDAVMDGTKFKIDFTNQTFASPGVLLCVLVLYGGNGEKISDKKFKAIVDSSLEDGAIISKDERGILDRAFDLATDVVPRMENIDVAALENYEQTITTVQNDITAYKADYDALKPALIQAKTDTETATADAEAKIVDVETRFNNLTTEQQQDAEVIDARQGKPSLGANMRGLSQQLADTKNAFNQAVSEVTVDSEVILARGGKDTLGERLDETDAQLADKANKAQEAWITPTLLNGWVDETSSTGLKFRKNGFGQLEFLGNITGGAENTIAFILPSGYIPPQIRFALVVSTLSFGVVYFMPVTGEVLIRIKGSGLTRVSFDNVIINI